MAERLDSRETVSVPELLKMEMIINQALIDILVEKGLFTHEELMAKVKEIKIKGGIVLSGEAGKRAS